MAIFAPAALYGAAVVSMVAIPAIILGNFIRRLCSDASLPKNLPWAGVGPDGGPVSRARANLRSFFGMKELLDEGYTRVT